MAVETERKYVVSDSSWRQYVASTTAIHQGYLTNDGGLAEVRVRSIGADAWITVKGSSQGLQRQEFEYAIPVEDSEVLLEQFCSTGVKKVRHLLDCGPGAWTVDVFDGVLSGLVLLEIEGIEVLDAPSLPEWVGPEVTFDPRFRNANLSRATVIPQVDMA